MHFTRHIITITGILTMTAATAPAETPGPTGVTFVNSLGMRMIGV